MCKNLCIQIYYWVISLKICVINCIHGTLDKVSVFSAKTTKTKCMVRGNVSFARALNKKLSERKRYFMKNDKT